MGNYTITDKEIKELEQLMGCKITVINSNKFRLMSKNGKEYSQTAYDLIEKLKYQRKLKGIIKESSSFKLSKNINPKLRARDWKTISVCMTTTEKAELETIKSNLSYSTLNQMIRDILLKIIEANK